jgi:PAS domain S-box-containing protein
MLPLHRKANDRTAIFLLYFNKLVLSYVFAEYPQALENAAITERYLDGGLGVITVPIFHFYESLTLLAVYPSAQKPAPNNLLHKVRYNQKKMKKWAAHAPSNFMHKFYLVEAERCRVLDKDAQARDLYDRAIAIAQENDYIQEKALAYELAAKFYLFKGKDLIARTYMQEARYCYLKWGATRKVRHLDETYPQLLASAQSQVKDTKITSTSTAGSSGEVLDLATVMKANQAISGEIVLDKLLENLMKILIENTGAQIGFLILDNYGKLLIEASGDVDCDKVTVLQSIPISSHEAVSQTIINYVARTKESVVLHDATHEGKFINNLYIKENKPKSILCVPLINQGKLISIVYLENNLTTGAFTPERLEIVKLLSSQAAISIENAKLYSEVKESESRLTQFLEAVPVGVSVLDANGNPYYGNRIAKQLLGKGCTPETTGEQLSEIYKVCRAGTERVYPRENLPGVRALMGESTRADDIEIHQGDKIIPIETWGTPIYDEKGNINYAIVAFQDITKRRKSEVEHEQFTLELFKLNKAFERFVPRQFLQFLDKKSIVDVQVGDQVQQEMSVLFSDIRDFTTLSESMTPQDNFKFINGYLSRMEPAIVEHQGFIDKYIGDAIMALFSGEADNAVKAGIDMLYRLAEYNQHRANSGYVPIQNGIGINTGSLMLGTVGGNNRMDGTVISDAVNLASRVESLTKNYGVSLLITHQTFSRLTNPENYAIRMIDRVKVKGKSELVTVYEVFEADLPAIKEGKLAALEIFQEALSNYNSQKFREAEQLFAECLRLNPMDRVTQIYLQHCQERV